MSNLEDKGAMSLFGHPGEPSGHGRFLAELLLIGGVQIESLANGKEKIGFQQWSEAVRNATAGSKDSLSDDQLEWLWEALTTEPKVQRELGARISIPRRRVEESESNTGTQ